MCALNLLISRLQHYVPESFVSPRRICSTDGGHRCARGAASLLVRSFPDYPRQEKGDYSSGLEDRWLHVSLRVLYMES